MKSDLTRKVTGPLTPTSSNISKASSASASASTPPKKEEEVIPIRYHDYIVLYHDGNQIAFEAIQLSRKPKGKPKEVAFALATILGLDHSKVVGVLHVLPGIEIKLSKCGMEMLFTLSK